MRRAVLWMTAVLLAWLGLGMVGLKIGNYLLVAKEWSVLEGTVFIILLAALLLFLVKESWGKIVLGFFLLLCFGFQFWHFWRFTVFGASSEIIETYNRINENTLRIFPLSAERIVPDLYHMVLAVLTVAAVVVWAVYLFRCSKEVSK